MTTNQLPKAGIAADRESERDSRLVRQAIGFAKNGDPEGIHFLYVRFSADVLRYVQSFVRDHHEAEDITQNVFAKLPKAIKKYEQREVPFAAWILRVARNAALDQMRARRAIPTEEVRIADADHTQENADLANDIRQALDQLPGDQREVLVLRHITGLSPTEIADALGKSESSIHGLHHRGRRTLQGFLTELGASPVVAA